MWPLISQPCDEQETWANHKPSPLGEVRGYLQQLHQPKEGDYTQTWRLERIICAMSPMMVDQPPGEENGFAIQQHGHKDMVQSGSFNKYGNRLALGSADGRIKVYDRHRDGSWVLCDTWAAHIAEVIEVHWLPSTIHPNLVASIATDGKFKLWAEDPTNPPLSGRRFNRSSNRPIFEMRSHLRSPFLSFSVKHNPETRHTFLALLDRNAMLTVYENEEPESMTSWTQIDQIKVCDTPERGEEATFKVRFDPNLEPSYAAIREGVPRDSLGLIVAGMKTARIWRTKVISHDVSLGSGSSKEFYLAADLPGHRGLVRDVAWASGSIRGYDVVATACKDGLVRVFEIRTPPKDGKEVSSIEYSKYPVSQAVVAAPRGPEISLRNGPSGISTGLAASGRSGPTGNRQQDGQSQAGQVFHTAKEVARLDAHRKAVWRVDFDDDGQMLGSTGDDGKLMLWRRRPDGSWSRSGELAMDTGGPNIRAPQNGDSEVT